MEKRTTAKEWGIFKNLQSFTKRKRKIRNSLTIERLGFDEETSFRGIEYHGQKRKLKWKHY